MLSHYNIRGEDKETPRSWNNILSQYNSAATRAVEQYPASVLDLEITYYLFAL